MKKILFFFLLTSILSAQSLEVEKNCEILFPLAEKQNLPWVYEYCGIKDETKTLNRLAPLFSQKNYKKALYAIALHHKDTDKAVVYLKKSAELNYPPALLQLALSEKESGHIENYKNLLLKIIRTNPLDSSPIKTPEQTIVMQSYRLLGLELIKEKNYTDAVSLLSVSADYGDAISMNALAVIYYWVKEIQDTSLSNKYLWAAILSNCPAAEDNWGILNLWEEKKITSIEAYKAMISRINSCQNLGDFSFSKECNCASISALLKSQSNKPYKLKKIEDETAYLIDKNGSLETIKKHQTTKAGYFVDEIKSTAVILIKNNMRYIILLEANTNPKCIQYCQNKGTYTADLIQDTTVYQLNFSESECQNLAEHIQDLPYPDHNIRGFNECLLNDWETWGKQALDNNANKHLYLLENYQKSAYLPAYIKEVENLFKSQNQMTKEKGMMILSYALEQIPTDLLSYNALERAYCMAGYLYLTIPNENIAKAFEVNLKGAEMGYPYSMNMLGVLYALGYNGPNDQLSNPDEFKEKAKYWFKKANEESPYPYMDALENLKTLFEGNTNFQFGYCNEIDTNNNTEPYNLINFLDFIK